MYKYSAIATTVDGVHGPEFVESFSRDPDAQIVLVRQESSFSGEAPDVIQKGRFTGVEAPVCSRTKALNIGLSLATADWLWILDIDVLLEGLAWPRIKKLSPGSVYGNDYRDYQIGELQCNYHWVDGWSILFHRDLYNLIGGFDEAFKASGYLDGDFCFRAAEAGFQSHWGNLPLRHLRSSTRLQLPGYAEGKAFNRAYLKEKWGLEELYG